MIQLKLIHVVAVAVSVMEGCHGDYHHGDYTSYANYYPEYSFNYSAPTSSNSQKRIFSDEITLAASVGISFDASIPLDDLNSAIYISVPFSFSLPEAVSTKSDGYGTGRSLSSVGPSRSSMYKSLEGYVARMTGSDGHACLLRAMCETSATPLHDDGLIGDAINFMLTGSYSARDAVDESYFEAQAKGQISGDCSAYYSNCPISFFKYLG